MERTSLSVSAIHVCMHREGLYIHAMTDGAGSGSTLCSSQFLEGRGKCGSVSSRPTNSYTERPHPKKHAEIPLPLIALIVLSLHIWGLLDFFKLPMKVYHTTCSPVGIIISQVIKSYPKYLRNGRFLFGVSVVVDNLYVYVHKFSLT